VSVLQADLTECPKGVVVRWLDCQPETPTARDSSRLQAEEDVNRLRIEYGEQLALDPIELDSITLDKYNTPAKIKREALTREEVRRLFDAIDSYRNRLLAIVAAETGLRNSDLSNHQFPSGGRPVSWERLTYERIQYYE